MNFSSYNNHYKIYGCVIRYLCPMRISQYYSWNSSRSFCFSIVLFSFFTDNLIKIIDGYNYNDQIIFFNLQLYSKIPEILLLISTAFLLNIGKSKWFFFLLLGKMIIYIILDFTLVNENVFPNAYIGLGLSSILTNIFLFVFSLLIIANFFSFKIFWNIKTFRLTKLEFNKVFFS